MNIPPPKPRKPFNQEILKISDEPHHDDESNEIKLIFDVNDNWINSIRHQLNENTQENEPEIEEEEEDHSQIEDQINDYKEKIQQLKEQNEDLCDLDFSNMSISEIDSEIEKTKNRFEEKKINYAYENDDSKYHIYQEKNDNGRKRISVFKKRAIGLYNEICAWSGPLLESRFGPDEKNPKIDVMNLNDVATQIKNHIQHLQNVLKEKKKKL